VKDAPAILMLNGRPPTRLLERLRPGPGEGFATLAEPLPVEEGPEGEAWKRPGLLVAADGGANALWRAGLPAGLIVGDLDSLLEEARDWHLARGAALVESHWQENNDLEKALELLKTERCWVAGFEGGRLDMLLGLLAHLAPEHRPRLRLLGEEQILIPLAHGTHLFSATAEEPFSLLALGGNCELELRGAHWGGHLELEPGCRGVSNRARGGPLEIALRRGALLLARRAPWAGAAW
jgi:thiamine pyrophosphokinase